MLFTTVILGALALAPSAVLSVPTNSSITDDCAEKAIAPTWYHTIVAKYFDFWGGDVNLAEQVFSPGLIVWQDRVPGANDSAPYPIFNTQDYLVWWQLSREGWERFEFINRYTFGYDNRVVVRWTLDAVLRDPALTVPGKSVSLLVLFIIFPSFPYTFYLVRTRLTLFLVSTITAGTHVAYNGTDVLTLNRCTGKIDMIESAQDFITYFHELGLSSVMV